MEHKRGDTWSFIGQLSVKGIDGKSVDVSGCSLKSEIRASPSGTLIATAECAWIDVTEQTFSHKVADTSQWPIGAAMVDVVLVNSDGSEISTDSASFNIVSRVTRA